MAAVHPVEKTPPLYWQYPEALPQLATGTKGKDGGK
jgi:hypothetical protein